MKRIIVLGLLLATAAGAQQVFDGISGGTESFQVLVPNTSDGGALVAAAPCVCCEQMLTPSDGGLNFCGRASDGMPSGTRILGDGGCGPMDNQKLCWLYNASPNPTILCSTPVCRDQRDGQILPSGQSVSLSFVNPAGGGGSMGAAAIFAASPAGTQVDGGGLGVMLGR
jgi:hypothetical protein